MPTPRRGLTEDRARRLVAERCLTPAGQPLFGLELEFLSFATDRALRPSIDALERVAAHELPSGGRITCEPGGQLEVSTTPQSTVGDAIEAAARDVAALRTFAAAEAIDVLAVGADRWREPERVVDSCRYRAMEAHFDTRGPDGRRMMCNTAALQVNVDGDASTWTAAHAIGPAMVAAFANSPDDDGCRSTRMTTWHAMDQRRAGIVDGPLPDAWIDYALDAPVLVAQDEQGDCVAFPRPVPLKQWISDGSTIGFPTERDVTYHLTTLFPPVRPRGWIEIRFLDALPSPWWEVATRVVTSLLAVPLNDTLAAAGDTAALWRDAARYGLDDERLAEAADRCFALALRHDPDPGVADYLERYVARRVPAWA